VTFPREAWPRLKEAFEGARALAVDARPAYLAEVCHGDEALRHEVELLLAHGDQAASFLETPAMLFDDSLVAKRLEGQCIGPYKVSALIGAGAMGEVYRARDTKLQRDVALKVLPERFALDPDRVARFTREAQLLATLNHPNIAAIYGLDETSGAQALVMELVDGPTLADRIARGPMPLAEALAIARQMAEAVEAAHEKGIIHRDLKPANIKIAGNGVVKVLDFGLAKVWDGAAQSDLSGSSKRTATHLGGRTILGTPAYMSPEQARGASLDRRTDIWSFGCVLFEMLTGRAPFAGDTISDTLAAILDHQPDWTQLPAGTPPPIRRLLWRCLDKDLKQRLRDIGEARVELGALVAATPRHWRPTSHRVGLNVLALLVVAGAIGVFYSTRSAAPVTSPSEYTQLTNFTDSAVAPSLSPDGRMVTFKRGEDSFLSRGQIYVKVLPNGESIQLTTDAARKYAPVFTPDGSRIAYSSRPTAGVWDTWIVPVPGGQPRLFLPNASGLTWIADHRVMFSEIKTGIHMGIVTAMESRTDSREIYFQPNEHAMAHHSYASPDRQWVLVVEMVGAHAFTERCRLIPFDGRSAGQQVGPQGPCTSAAWSPDGKWMYFGATVGGKSHLWRQSFPDGAPEQITFGPLEEEGIAVAPDGRSLVTSVGTRRSAIWIHDAAGERAITSEGYAAAPRLSRDATHVFYLLARDWVLSRFGWTPSSSDLRSVDLASGKTDSLLPGVSVTDYDISSDETEVAFTTADSSGEPQIWLASLDRRTPPRQVARAGDQVSFAADGHLVFRSLEANTNRLIRIKKDGTGPDRITTAPVLDKFGVSPDGEWVLISSPGAGVDAVPATLAVPIRSSGPPRKICVPACQAGWSSDGKFFHVSLDSSNVSSPGTAGRVLAIQVPVGKALPELPVSGIDVAAAVAELPGTRVVEHGSLLTGPDPSTFVFTRTDLQRNLFRIPLH
jgi:serine/threonine protein kinase/Tol biopolymer transport system component